MVVMRENRRVAVPFLGHAHRAGLRQPHAMPESGAEHAETGQLLRLPVRHGLDEEQRAQKIRRRTVGGDVLERGTSAVAYARERSGLRDVLDTNRATGRATLDHIYLEHAAD